MSAQSPIPCLNVCKWLTVALLFVAIGCIFVKVRAGHEATRDRIIMLDRQAEEIDVRTKSVRAQIKAALGPNALASRLFRHDSLLTNVSVERTEVLDLPRVETAEARR